MHTIAKTLNIVHWYFSDPLMQVLGGRFLKLAGADVVPDGQATDAQESCDHAYGNVSVQILPDEIISNTASVLAFSPWL